jgi:hypothetical protein
VVSRVTPAPAAIHLLVVTFVVIAAPAGMATAILVLVVGFAVLPELALTTVAAKAIFIFFIPPAEPLPATLPARFARLVPFVVTGLAVRRLTAAELAPALTVAIVVVLLSAPGPPGPASLLLLPGTG